MLPVRPQAAQVAAQPATGGFMRTAMTTAAGVAGGMLLAEGIRNMRGGNSSAQASTAASHAEKQKAQDAADDEREDARDDDYDPSQNDTVDWGGDLDI